MRLAQGVCVPNFYRTVCLFFFLFKTAAFVKLICGLLQISEVGQTATGPSVRGPQAHLDGRGRATRGIKITTTC